MARVQVLSTPGCAGCAQAKRTVTDVLSELPGLDWEEIDLVEHPEVAERYGVMSVPAIAIDGELAFASVPRPDALRERVKQTLERS